MAVWCVAVCKEKLKGPIEGYFLCDTGKITEHKNKVNGQIVTYKEASRIAVTAEQLSDWLSKHSGAIENMEVVNGEAKINSGALENYAVLNVRGDFLGIGSRPASEFYSNGNFKMPLIVTGKLSDVVGLEIILPSGRTGNFSEQAIIADAEHGGRVLSNAYIVTENNRKYVRSKHGELDRKNLLANNGVNTQTTGASKPATIANNVTSTNNAPATVASNVSNTNNAPATVASNVSSKPVYTATADNAQSAQTASPSSSANDVAPTIVTPDKINSGIVNKDASNNVADSNKSSLDDIPDVDEEDKEEPSGSALDDIPDAEEPSGSALDDIPDDEETGGSALDDIPDAEETEKDDKSALDDIPEAEESNEASETKEAPVSAEEARAKYIEERTQSLHKERKDSVMDNLYEMINFTGVSGTWTERDTEEFIEFRTFANTEIISRFRLEKLSLTYKAFGDGKCKIPFPVMHNGKAIRVMDAAAVSLTGYVSSPSIDRSDIDSLWVMTEAIANEILRGHQDEYSNCLGWIEHVRDGLLDIKLDYKGVNGFRVVDARGMWHTSVMDEKRGVICTEFEESIPGNTLDRGLIPKKSSFFTMLVVPSLTSEGKVISVLKEMRFIGEPHRMAREDAKVGACMIRVGNNITEMHPQCMKVSTEFLYGVDLSGSAATFIPEKFARFNTETNSGLCTPGDNAGYAWIKLSERITKIHEEAFYGLENAYINIPSSVQEIAREAFKNTKFDRLKFSERCCFKTHGAAFLQSYTEQPVINLGMTGAGVSSTSFGLAINPSLPIAEVRVPGSILSVGRKAVCCTDKHGRPVLGGIESIIFEDGTTEVKGFPFYCFEEVHVPRSIDSFDFTAVPNKLHCVSADDPDEVSDKYVFKTKVYISVNAKSMQSWRMLEKLMNGH